MKTINKINIIQLLVISLLVMFSNFAAAQDPGDTGPFSVSSAEYNRGDLAFRPSGFPTSVEVTANVHYPSDLSQGNFPLVVFLHGRHVSCLRENSIEDGGDEIVSFTTSFQWPCVRSSSIPSYKGYNYVANTLASHGYIVVSISANAIAVRDNETSDGNDGGANARARLIQHHLDIWNGFNTNGSGEFGSLFVNKIDMNNIGTMGHSRGGEGVVANFNFNNSLGSPYGIRAVLPIAPTNVNRFQITDVPLGVVLPYCDGDVAGLEGVHFFDDTRYSSETDNAPKHTFLMMGANHNFFNTIWTPGLFPSRQPDSTTTIRGNGGAADDWSMFRNSSDSFCGAGVSNNQRLSSGEQRSIATTLITGFFRTYLGGETQFNALLKGDIDLPNAVDGSDVHVSYHAPANERLDINRLDSEGTETVNTLGENATQNGLTTYDICGDDATERNCLNLLPDQQPHTRTSFFNNRLGLSQLLLAWNSNDDSYANILPISQSNISGYSHLQFRAGVNFVDSSSGQEQDFQVELLDRNGGVGSVRISDVSDALFFPPGSIVNRNVVPKLLLNTVRLPLDLFDGVDMTNVAGIRFNFGETAQGAISISDLALTGNRLDSPTIRSENFTEGRYRLRWRLVTGAQRYEWRLNGGEWQVESATTTRNDRMFLNVGDNTFDLRACNTSSCSATTSIVVEYGRQAPGMPFIEVRAGDGPDRLDSTDRDEYTFSWRSTSQATYYNLRLNEGAFVNLGLVNSTTVSSLLLGENKIDLQACNEGGCSEAALLYLTVFEEED